MTKIKIEVEFDIDDNNWCANSKDKEEKEWFWNEILPSSTIILHNDEIGDVISQTETFIIKQVNFNTQEKL